MIHPTAIVDSGAELGKNVSIGPYSVIEKNVTIHDDCEIGPHVVIKGPTEIGKGTRIFQFSSIGDAPQDKKYGGEDTRLIIGERNVIRECCTINRGTVQDRGITRIGNDNWIMAYVHIAHDCLVGNNIILANNTGLAGHVVIEDLAIMGAYTAIHQFCHVGAHSFSALCTVINKDVPPFIMVSGNTAQAYGLNTEGLKRRGFTAERMQIIKDAYKILYRQGLTFDAARDKLKTLAGQSDDVKMMVDFLQQVTRGIVR